MNHQLDPQQLGAALAMALQIHQAGARCSGRTQALIDILRPGDVVVCAGIAEQRGVRARLRERGVNAEARLAAANYEGVRHLMHGLPSTTRVFLHHDWIAAFYEAEIGRARRHLGQVQELLKPRAPEIYYGYKEREL